MSHILSFIGDDNNTYVTTEDGNTTPNVQNVSINCGIDVTSFGHRDLAEQSVRLKLYKTNSHNYYKITDMYIVQDTSIAADMPMYLSGWKTSSDVIVQPNQIVTQRFIADNFVNGNMDLYGVWNNTSLIRVIVFIPNLITEVSGNYDVQLEANSSYSTLDPFCLNNDFKSITDNGIDVEYTDGSHTIQEFGSGDGCPNNGFVTYYGVKTNDSVSLITSPSTGLKDYIPYYTLSNDTPLYECYVAPYLVRNEKNPKNSWTTVSMDYVPKDNSWTVSNSVRALNSIQGDKTIFIQLVHKPTVTVNITPSGVGTVTGSGSFMPGDICTLTAASSGGVGRNRFDYYLINGRGVRQNPYSFVVTQDITVTAVFLTD